MPRLEPLLGQVNQPSRYLGGELNQILKPEAAYRVAFMYPDTYEIGAANLAVAILYDVLNQVADVACERVYLPWLDMQEAMRAAGIPLFSLESHAPVGDFDLFCITLPHELAATNILRALDLAGIPLCAADRGEADPLVFGGGPVSNNPAPLSAFFDGFSIGEGEEALPELAALLRDLKAKGVSRAEQLQAAAALPGFYVPGVSNPQVVVRKRIDSDWRERVRVLRPIVPYPETMADRVSVEIMRGCVRGCRFCQAGATNMPLRLRSVETIEQAVYQELAATGFDEVSLTSLSSTDHPQIVELLRRLNRQLGPVGVKVSLPSQRMDAFGVDAATAAAAGAKKGSLTFAPEAATQRLRDLINKGISRSQIESALLHAVELGWRKFKLYFMFGLPGERESDVVAIAGLCDELYQLLREALPPAERGALSISASVGLFVPKPHTPFQWCGQLPLPEARKRLTALRAAAHKLPRAVRVHWHDLEPSQIEAVLARGDAQVSQLILAAHRHGASFDAWSEQFDYGIWQKAAADCGLDLEALASHELSQDAALPWQMIGSGARPGFLQHQYQKFLTELEVGRDQ
jgi:radical SAM family uncharacterized protein